MFGSIKAVTVRNTPGSTLDYGANVEYAQVVLISNVASVELVRRLSAFSTAINEAQISYSPFKSNSNSYAYSAIEVLIGIRPRAAVLAPAWKVKVGF